MATSDIRQKRQILGIILVAVGVIGLGAGLWGFSAKSQTEATISRPDVALQLAFSDSGRSSVTSALNTMAAIGTAGLVAGIVSLLLGIVVLATLPKVGATSDA